MLFARELESINDKDIPEIKETLKPDENNKKSWNK